MGPISWDEFAKIELRVGTIVKAEPFPEARKPSCKLVVDFGERGQLRSSAQIAHHYSPENLVGKQVVAVVNFPPKQIGQFISECLVTGFADENSDVVLAVPDKAVPNGSKLF